MQGLNEVDMKAVVNTYNLNDFYYPTLFPLKQSNSLTWKSLEITTGMHIAADIVARGTSIAAKSREALARIQGDIPKIAVKRVMEEDELNEYTTMLALSAGNPDKQRLIEAWANDTEFCWNGVASRLEWTALRSISAGKVTLTDDNNVGPVTAFDLDYQLGNRKVGYQTGSASWANTSSAKPITCDFRQVIASARAKGIYLKYAFMNMKTFAEFAATEEVVKMCASYFINTVSGSYIPDINTVNNTLSKIAYLYGLQIRIIDQSITIEKADGSRADENPFIDDSILFSETEVLGNTHWVMPIDMNRRGTAAYCVMNGHTCVKKYSTDEPVTEVTLGIANAFPGWAASTRSYLMDSHNSSWNH